ncbi:hypothetical protein PPERSA_01041 [Pseudocohnilembus persalinus]|uniref:Uncharacterized protein n=1 Tax=Pseudocohnilembus persalinus TaxID=266149 RepID=A0A0V0QUN8_PSEPJ|nr:hypothetical protein PPERSA_01041 [Pseudocohnilembus persalinus]|eukprot:KRX05963.1 hypothetical protein PPERSA_01041 [Pseudocohnilembus persalinus]
MDGNQDFKKYIIRQTVQKNSLRGEEAINAEVYKNKNLKLYFNKKIKELKKVSHNKNVPLEQLANSIQLEPHTIQMLTKQQERMQKIKVGDRGQNAYIDINQQKLQEEVQQRCQDSQLPDELKEQKQKLIDAKLRQTSKKQQKMAETNKVKKLVGYHLEDQYIRDLYQKFLREELQEKINKWITQGQKSWHIADNFQMQKKQGKLEFLSKVQIDKFMNNIIEKLDLSVGSILGLKDVYYKTVKQLQDEKKTQQLREGKNYQDLIDAEIDAQEERNQKAIVKIFKDNQLDQNEINQFVMKKKSQVQAEQEKKLWEEEKGNYRKVGETKIRNPKDFIRKKKTDTDYMRFLKVDHQEALFKLSQAKNKKGPKSFEQIRKSVNKLSAKKIEKLDKQSQNDSQCSSNIQNKKQSPKLIKRFTQMLDEQQKKEEMENSQNNEFQTEQDNQIYDLENYYFFNGNWYQKDTEKKNIQKDQDQQNQDSINSSQFNQQQQYENEQQKFNEIQLQDISQVQNIQVNNNINRSKVDSIKSSNLNMGSTKADITTVGNSSKTQIFKNNYMRNTSQNRTVNRNQTYLSPQDQTNGWITNKFKWYQIYRKSSKINQKQISIIIIKNNKEQLNLQLERLEFRQC